MKKLHAKSSCCNTRIINYGCRRRQCTNCRKTWRIREKRRGRKCTRGQIKLIRDFFNHAIGSSLARSQLKNKGARSLQRQLVRSRNLLCRVSKWPTLPNDYPLILVADAMVKCFRGKWYTTYFMLIRSPSDQYAVILPPIMLPGLEGQYEWQYTINTLPKVILANIKVLVCDGHRGLVNYAINRHWLIQRCHFHILSAIQGRRSRWARSRHRQEGKLVHSLTKEVLKSPVNRNFIKTLLKLENIALTTDSPELKRVLLGFIHYSKDYRTYLYYPELNLPRTSNSAESLIGCVESLLFRMRGVSDLKSLEKWIEAFIKHKRKIRCNGFYQPNK